MATIAPPNPAINQSSRCSGLRCRSLASGADLHEKEPQSPMVAKTAMTELWERSRVKSCRHRSAGDDKRDQGHASGMFDVVTSARGCVRTPRQSSR